MIGKIIFSVFLGVFLLGCEKKEPLEQRLNNKINNYINVSEDYAKTTSTYHETDIYILKFKTIDSREYIKIFENNYYYKKELDGYYETGDNKVFLYNSYDDFVNLSLLKSANNIKEPDESSELVDQGFNSVTWYFEIVNNELVRIDDEGFFFY